MHPIRFSDNQQIGVKFVNEWFRGAKFLGGVGEGFEYATSEEKYVYLVRERSLKMNHQIKLSYEEIKTKMKRTTTGLTNSQISLVTRRWLEKYQTTIFFLFFKIKIQKLPKRL